MTKNIWTGFIVSAGLCLFVSTSPAVDPPPKFQVPAGFVVEKVAGPPLVNYPMFAALDNRGRLYVAEGTGTNMPGEQLVKLKKQLGKITLLEDTDGDGKYDTAKTFADDLTFPTGVLWHDGFVYGASHPNLWRFQDKDGDGKADVREALVSKFNFNGNGCDVHGPFMGPDGWLYWTDGRHGYKINTKEGTCLEGFASRIWRCRPDGAGIERIAGGGFDNPVELAFTPEGDIIGTMDQGPGDAILHYVEGGVYPMDHPCVKEFAMTGPMLGAVRQYTASLPVALCGMCRYRSPQFGPEYQGALFTSQFNVHRVQQHTLTREGATYRCKDKDFLTSNDYDVHVTDVLEDADGSLLVVDMGAWFNYGCPNSKIAKPEIKGAIYRIRRTGVPAVKDPWGKALDLDKKSPRELVALLDDARPKVQDQILARLARLGNEAVPELTRIVKSDGERSKAVVSREARRNAVWALCRIRTIESRAALRHALADKDASVRQATVHAMGLERYGEAGTVLAELAAKDEPAIRLKAAEALGRIGRPQAIPAILESVRQGNLDRFLEHSLIYALIQINDAKATLPALEDPNPRVRQAGLIALDQMKDGKLTREQVVPLLDTDDPDLQQAVLGVISKRLDWSKETIGLLKEWLGSGKRTPGQEKSLTGALLAFSAEENIQKLVADTLADAKTTLPTRLLMLQVLARCRLEQLPARWIEALGQAAQGEEATLRREAVAAVKARNLSQFDKILLDLSKEEKQPADLRIAALDCLAPRQSQLLPALFTLLTQHLSEKVEPLQRVAAARTLGASPLTKDQLITLAGQVSEAGPMIVPLLMPAYVRSREADVGHALVKALQKSPGTDALAVEDLDRLLRNYPEEVQKAAQPLHDKLAAKQKEQEAYLTQLTLELLNAPGNAERGKEVFFSKKVACYGCHKAMSKGGSVGPDLSLVGRFRTTKDLLESVVFPSSSIIPDFRSYVVTTKDGRSATGMIVRESSEEVFLRTAQLAEIRIARKDIDEMTPSPVSIMPQGLEKILSRQELSDLLEFLYNQR